MKSSIIQTYNKIGLIFDWILHNEIYLFNGKITVTNMSLAMCSWVLLLDLKLLLNTLEDSTVFIVMCFPQS